MFEKFTEKAKRVLFLARYEASQMGSRVIGTEHLLLGLLKEGEEVTREMFQRSNIALETLRAELEDIGPSREKVSTSVEIPFSEETKRALKYAEEEANRLLHSYVGSEHLLLGLLRVEHSTAARALQERGMELYAVREDTIAILKKRGVPKRKQETPFLNEFSQDLTATAESGLFDPLIGREAELERVVQILSRRRKNNPVLLGEPGVGKTAIVEGLSQRIVEGDVPPSLVDKRILSLDLSLVVAGTKYRGQFEERLKGIISELSGAEDVIIFIDEIHSLIGAGSAEGSLDAANILKPALSVGDVQCIGATTPRDYHKYIEKDRALVRRFQSIKIAPPSEAETINILQGIKDRYERFHQVRYADDAVLSAVYLSNRYITDRFLPDKAIDVIDEAGARVKLRKRTSYIEVKQVEGRLKEATRNMKRALARKDFERAVRFHDEEMMLRRQCDELRRKCEDEGQMILEVEKSDIEDVISRWTGIPLATVKKEEMQKLMKMEEYLHERIVGQHSAISALSRAIRRSRAGLKNPMRPMGSFIFLGPTGVGKTEVARTLAAFLFGNETALVRFDMSEYMEKHAIARMIGSPPGYVGHEEGGQLTERIKRKPYSVILLDEIEKAHPDVLNILLQVFEDGQLTDAYGDAVDFKNTLVIMTSNIGSSAIDSDHRPGFLIREDGKEGSRHRNVVMQDVKKTLSPEFLNRIDEIIVFDALSDDDLLKICRLMIGRLNETLKSRSLEISLTDEACRWLLKTTVDERSYGARPLRRAIQRHIEDVLSEDLIQGKFPGCGHVQVYLEGDQLAFRESPELTRAT
ncbi:MAG: ATP-dependent Clp protease ATP-binding subunit [Acidobacteriota bacterium]